MPLPEMIPHLLATSDVLGTGWFAADAANVRSGMTVAVVGDGAVGPMGILSVKQKGAERILAMSRHEKRQKLALEFGATGILAQLGDEDVARVKELTKGVSTDALLECVGTQQSMHQAVRSARPDGFVSLVGVPHEMTLTGEELFWSMVHSYGDPTPVRRFLPNLIDLVWTGKIQPGKVLDLDFPLDRAAEGYGAMDERTAVERFHPSGIAALSTEKFGAAVEHLDRYKQLTVPEEIQPHMGDEEWTLRFR